METQLWQRIRAARKHSKLTQEQVAEALGITHVSVAQWESKKPEGRTSPSSDNLRRLARVLGVGLDWLGSDHSKLEALQYRAAGSNQSAVFETGYNFVAFPKLIQDQLFIIGLAAAKDPEIAKILSGLGTLVANRLDYLPAGEEALSKKKKMGALFDHFYDGSRMRDLQKQADKSPRHRKPSRSNSFPSEKLTA